MTNDRPSPAMLMLRMFGTIFFFMFLMSMFWNGLSGTNMFPFRAVIGASVALTILFTSVGWTVSTAGSKLLLKNNEEYQDWKKKGGRPYWDSLGWPINTATPIERQTGLAEPEYPPGMTPPDHHQYQCPVCGCRVEKQIDICPLCNYGADGDSSAYVRRWGTSPPSSPPQCSGPSCQPKPQGWRPVS